MGQPEALDGACFIRMMRAGHEELSRRKDEINALNVFPVPDGDTGTNMYLSFTSGVEQLCGLPSNASLERLTHALSLGLLMGARGNSGVILSQLFRGFQLAWNRSEQIGPRLFAQALVRGVDTAYKAVSRPVEGTILTVAREAAQAALRAAGEPGSTVERVLMAAIESASVAVERTPDLLPVLREAGVVDSGGKGLLYIYNGFLRGLRSLYDAEGAICADERWSDRVFIEPESFDPDAFSKTDAEFGYCTEFLVRAARHAGTAARDLRTVLETVGDSLLVVEAEGLVKVHLHTQHPGRALEEALAFGALSRIKIDNMTEQHHAFSLFAPGPDAGLAGGPRAPSVAAPASAAPPALAAPSAALQSLCGFVAVTLGDGFGELFRTLGAGALVEGGPGMNPSTEELVQAIRAISAERVFLLPNHPNVVMAAEQAALVDGDGKRVRVIDARSLGAGLAAALAFRPDVGPDENERAMQEAARRVTSGAVTQAVRPTSAGGRSIAEGDYLAFADGEIVGASVSRTAALQEAVLHLLPRARDLCTIFCADRDLMEEARRVGAELRSALQGRELEVQYGGQPIYDYILAVE